MEMVFSNGVQYSIEFIKLVLVLVGILNMQVKKNINVLFAMSLAVVMGISYWFDMSQCSILYAFIAVIVFFIVLVEKRNIAYVVLAFVAISIIDMMFGMICINAFELNEEQIHSGDIVAISINSISLILILIILFILRKRREEHSIQKMEKIHPIIFLSSIILSVNLTYAQLVSMQDVQLEYRKELIVSAICITMVCFLICYILTRNLSKNQYLSIENDMNQRLIKAQNDYYSLMLKKETETKMFRHDIKQHIRCMQLLYDQKRYDELGKYLGEMYEFTRDLSPEIATGNMYIDMIVADIASDFTDVEMEWIGKVPLLHIESMDICTLFYNLLKNAFESADKVSEKKVRVIVKKQGVNLMIVVSNYYDKLERDENEKYRSTKQEKGHGYGMKNISKCVKKYEGSYIITTDERRFTTEIILSDVIVDG